jgi:two-component system, cell cycle sensor histidine kinase and response regulator CckA
MEMTMDALTSTEAILLVEDDDAVREVASRALIARGYRLLVARNGEEALTVADEHQGPIHLVISDIVMPEMGGLQLFNRLRSWYPGIRFLFISGYADPPIDRRDLDDGRTRFLSKPFTLHRLVREGRALLDRADGTRLSDDDGITT